MRKKLALLATTALAGGMWVAPALADVSVTVDVNKTKDISVVEHITINKSVDVTVDFTANFEGFAEADALVNATNSGHNTFLAFGQGPLDETTPCGFADCNFLKRLAVIDGSVDNNTGVILGLNQDVGDNANQGNVVSLAFADVPVGPDPDAPNSVVANAQAAVDQRITDNIVRVIADFPGGVPPLPATSFQVRAEINDSVNDNIGVIQVNQNADENPNQHNVLSIALGDSAGLALGESDLGQENSGNQIEDYNTYKSAIIDGSINRNEGIVSVNQNAGHNNNQAAIITIAATTAATNLTPSP